MQSSIPDLHTFCLIPGLKDMNVVMLRCYVGAKCQEARTLRMTGPRVL